MVAPERDTCTPPTGCVVFSVTWRGPVLCSGLCCADGAQGDAAKAAADGAADGAAGEGGPAADGGESAVLAAVLAAVEAEEVSCEEDAALLDRLGQLDLLLTWLWRVHGIDYYAGKELLQEAEYEARLDRARTIRGPRPEEGEEQDEAEGG